MKTLVTLLNAIVVLSALCLPATVSAQQKMRHYDVSEGLSSNSVKGMIQDERGYIWFATPDGLNVFNGKEFKSFGCSYQPDGAEGADAINILTILQHKDGKQIWAATHSSSLFLFNPAYGSFREILICGKKGTPMPNVCYSMTYDNSGRLWIGTDMGIWIYDEEQSSFSVFSNANSNLPSDLIQCLHRDAEGTVWIGTDKGLVRFNPSTESFLPTVADRMDFRIASGLHISTISDGPSGNLWIGTWNDGLALYDKRLNTIRAVRPGGETEAASTMRIRSILADNSDLLWLSSNVGLFKYDIVDNKLSRVILSTSGPNNNFYSSLKDKEGGIWFGTFFQGAWYLSPRARQIECYTSDNVENHFKGSAVSAFCEDKSGHIYIASENGGLSLFNPMQRTFLPLNFSDVGRNLHALCIMGDELFIGTFTQGLKIVNLNTGRVCSHTVEDTPAIQSDNVFSLYGDERGTVYIGTEQGCTVYETSSGRWRSVAELRGEFIYDIEQDRNGDLWFASYYNGVYRYDAVKDSWTHYMHDDFKSGVLPGSKTIGLFADDRGNLWICTEGGGVCRYDYDADCFRNFTLLQDDGEIRLSLVYGILNDSCGRLWMSSNDGIYVCQENGQVLRHITHEDGLQSDQYNFGAAYRSAKGQLYFGGVYGFNVLNPDLISDICISPVATARIRYKDKDGKTVYSERETSFSSIRLPGSVSSFTMDFECLSYLSPLKNRFSYKIDDKGEWLTTAESSVTFLHFPFGRHSVMVRCCNGEGYWSENEVVFNIDNVPPFYMSTAAKILYCILAFLFLGAVIVLIIRRHDERSRAQYAEMKAEQDRKAYQSKIDFFTYVAHEIKTPVSLIKAPLESVLQNEHREEEKHNLEIMLKNTDRLLNLVNQLLDFKKISSDGHCLKMMACDPAELLLNVTNRFEGAMTGSLHISVNLPQARFRCLLDPEAFTKIISNLVSNAVKHAESVILVSLAVTEGPSAKSLRIEVRDDGCGIPEKDRTRIFDSFYQVNSQAGSPLAGGVGLGLSLGKLLVRKHNGVVYVDDAYKEGCGICVEIPMIDAPEIPEKLSGEVKTADDESFQNSGTLNLLIVEDTSDMLDFISGIFRDSHRIFKAGNGQDALEILRNTDIDLIISDISMPVMDGFELLKSVRSSEMLCHIPVIMLTVESALETKIRGLEYGADAYIEKPFSTSHLKATVDNLIARRENMRKRYMLSPLKNDSESIVVSRDKEWFDNLVMLIQDNIQEAEISIEELALQLNMSRSSFQRKLKGLTGLSPVEFVRLVRLKKAAELLSTGNYRVNEVCFMVGFNKPSYFSSLFKKQFGMLPKDFIAQMHQL